MSDADGRGDRFAIIIPARFDSSRFPGKPLAPLRGATGERKPLIQRSWECARAVTGTDSIWIATDDERIADTVRGFGGQVVMTTSDLRNGTERCAQAVDRLGLTGDVIVNLQGDAPLTPPIVVETLIEALIKDSSAMVATPAIACSPTLYEHLMTDQAAGRVGGTTVVSTSTGSALYFSKQVIPHVPVSRRTTGYQHVRLHLGLYAYRPEALHRYMELGSTELEEIEGLEQLRFLDRGTPIRTVLFDPLPWDCVELNNPEDIPVIEPILAKRGID